MKSLIIIVIFISAVLILSTAYAYNDNGGRIIAPTIICNDRQAIKLLAYATVNNDMDSVMKLLNSGKCWRVTKDIEMKEFTVAEKIIVIFEVNGKYLYTLNIPGKIVPY